MIEALDLLKADPLAINIQVEADWQVAGNRGHRAVNIGDVVAFDQNASDLLGNFKMFCPYILILKIQGGTPRRVSC